MRHAVIIGWLIYCCLGPALPRCGADAGESRRSVLAGAAALDKPVTYSESKVSLGELVQKISTDTGVGLTAAADVADEPVAVVVKEFPARDLLVELADLLDYRWSRQGRDGERRYHVWQDLASKRREEALRRARSAAVESQFRRELQCYVKMASLSQHQIQSLLQAEVELQEEVSRLSLEQQRVFWNSRELGEWEQRLRIATELWSPIAQALARLVGRLSGQQWTHLREEGQIVFSTDPLFGELRLPAEAARVLRTSEPDAVPAALRVAPGALDYNLQEIQEAREWWSAATGYRVIIRLTTTEDRLFCSRALAAAVTPMRGREPAQPSYSEPGPGLRLGVVAERGEEGAGADEKMAPRAQSGAPEMRRRAALAGASILGVRRAFRPDLQSGSHESALRSGHTSRRVYELLPEIARAYGPEPGSSISAMPNFIADAYENAPAIAPEAYLAGEPMTLEALLDRLTRAARYAGGPPRITTHDRDLRGNLIRLRSRTWFFDRRREIPLRLIRRWRTLCEQHGALPLEIYLTEVAPLSERQVESLFDLVTDAGLPYEFRWVRNALWALRLYASLPPEQQHALWAGRSILVTQMTARQRAFFVTAMQQFNDGRSPPLSPADCAAGSFFLTREQLVRVRDARGGVEEFVAPMAPPIAGPRPETRPRPLPAVPGTTADQVARYSVTKVEFHLRYGLDFGDNWGIIVAAPP